MAKAPQMLKPAAIWKYELPIANEQTVVMPSGARCLSAQLQLGVLCVWAVVEPTAPTVERRFLMSNTGAPLPDIIAIGQARYLDTVQLESGRRVIHVFEVPEENL